MLENASETVRLDEAPVRISGLEIPLGAYARLGKKDLPLKEITDRIGEHGEEYQILLAHHPGYIQEYLEYGADMILSLATLYYDNGISLQAVRDYLGHEYEEMTRQYVDYMPKKLEKASEAYFQEETHSFAAELMKGEFHG